MTVPIDLEQVKVDIRRARAWARKHFNVGGSNRFLDSPVAAIDFSADRMVVHPTMFGIRMDATHVEYRLKWVDGEVGWEGYGILSGEPMRWLKVE